MELRTQINESRKCQNRLIANNQPHIYFGTAVFGFFMASKSSSPCALSFGSKRNFSVNPLFSRIWRKQTHGRDHFGVRTQGVHTVQGRDRSKIGGRAT